MSVDKFKLYGIKHNYFFFCFKKQGSHYRLLFWFQIWQLFINVYYLEMFSINALWWERAGRLAEIGTLWYDKAKLNIKQS